MPLQVTEVTPEEEAPATLGGRIKDWTVGMARRLLKLAAVGLVVLELFVSGYEPQSVGIDTARILSEVSDLEMTIEDRELLDRLIGAVNEPERRPLDLHTFFAAKNGELFFKEGDDAKARHIVYRPGRWEGTNGQIDITYDKGRSREIQLMADNHSYYKCVLVYGDFLGFPIGATWLGRQIDRWTGNYTCYTYQLYKDTDQRAYSKYEYRHAWLGWWAKFRDWDRRTMLDLTEPY